MATVEQEVSTCDASRLTWSTSTSDTEACAGPWKYQLHEEPCYIDKVSTACPVTVAKTCRDPLSCPDPHFGASSARETKTRTVSEGMTPKRRLVCIDMLTNRREEKATPSAVSGGGPELDPGSNCDWETYYVPDTTGCGYNARSWRDSLIPDYLWNYQDLRNGVTATCTCPDVEYAVDGYDVTCTQKLTNFPVWNVGTSATYCGQGPEYDCSEHASCRHWTHGLDSSPAKCGPASTSNYSSPGLSRAQLRASVAAAAHVLYEGTLPTCLSCESLPMGTAPGLTEEKRKEEVEAKFACLDTQLTNISAVPSEKQTQLKDVLYKHLKLLYELQAKYMSPTTLTKVKEQYLFTTAHHDCGLNFTPPTPPTTCTKSEWLHILDTNLDSCRQLLASHVTPEAMMVHLRCTDVAWQIGQIVGGGCNEDIYQDAYRDTVLGVLDRYTQGLPVPATGAPDANELKLRLAAISRWYAQAKKLVDLGGTRVGDKLQGDLSRQMGNLWQAVHGRYAARLRDAADAGVPADAGVLTQPFVQEGLDIDLAVLNAALSSAPSLYTGDVTAMSGLPLLMVLGDGMHAMHERLADVSKYHDLGCLYSTPSCKSGGAQTELSQLWSLLSLLPDEGKLGTRLGSATLVRTAWKDFFTTLHGRHAVLRDAVSGVAGVPYDSTLLLTVDPRSTPAELFFAMVQDANTRVARYATTGLLSHAKLNSLQFGISAGQRTNLRNLITLQLGEFEGEVRQFQQDQRTQMLDRYAEFQNQRDQAGIRERVDQLVAEYNDMSEQLAGMRHVEEVEEVRFADAMKAFDSPLGGTNAAGVAFETMVDRPSITPLTIVPSDARYAPSTSQNPEDVSHIALTREVASGGGIAPGYHLELLKGDVLNIAVDGKWSPTCTLSTAKVRNPISKTEVTLSGAGALTGPEGYLVQWSSTAATLASNQSVMQQGVYLEPGEEPAERDVACAGGRYRPPDTGVNPPLEDDIEDGAYYTYGCSSYDGVTDSTQRNWSAAFASGLRVQGTPFSQLPAGSLLLVGLPHGEPTTRGFIKDIRVLQSPINTVIANEALDYYLVVNDKAGCSGLDSHALTVSFRHLRPARNQAAQFGQAVASVLTTMRARTDERIAQGTMLATDLDDLRNTANQALYTACASCNVDAFPEQFKGAFRLVVSKELARLERRVAIRATERALRLRTMQLDAMRSDLAYADSQARMLGLLSAWSMRNLDGVALRDSGKKVADLLVDHLYPVVDLRYPGTLLRLNGNANLAALRALDWTAPLLELSKKGLSAAKDIDGALALEWGVFSPPPAYPIVGLTFVRTGAPEYAFSNSTWKRIRGTRADNVWEDLRTRGRLSIALEPEDLYSANTGAARLGCTEAVPVIRSVALFFTRLGEDATNATLNSPPWRVPLSVAKPMVFPSETGMKSYTMDGAGWGFGQARVLFGDANLAADLAEGLEFPHATDTSGAGVANGLSPFTTFDFNLQSFWEAFPGPVTNPLLDAQEIMVLFSLDVRGATSAVKLPGICQPITPPAP